MSLSRTKTKAPDYVFTSESVAEGHPDKICDQVSDSILDLFLRHDPHSRAGVETMASTNRIILAGEVRGPAAITPDMIEETVRQTIKGIGYEQDTFHWNKIQVHNFLNQQSADIALGVDNSTDASGEEGAGDQGLMFGYACTDTPVFMPAAIYYSHRILEELSQQRKSGTQPLLGPDAKSQVTLRFVNHLPVEVDTIVVSTQHHESLSQDDVRNIVRPAVSKVLPKGWTIPEQRFFVNPTGRFVIGGPHADAGLTGRKIIVDTYGGSAPHGGGAFSGKDPSKVDRSAAYMCRYMAKNVVASGLADVCTIQVSYAIGMSQPTSVYISTDSTGRADDKDISAALMDLLDLSPGGIKRHLNLLRPIYQRTASYGHFGREAQKDGGFSWEKTDLVDELQTRFGLKGFQPTFTVAANS